LSYSIYLSLLAATCGTETTGAPVATPPLRDVTAAALDRVQQLVDAYRAGPITAARTAQFEEDLRSATRSLALAVTAWTHQQLEPAPAACALHVRHEGTTYHRLQQKTPQTVSTLFGEYTLYRLGYRAPRSAGVPVLFPLVQALGIVHGATPALAARAARYQAEAGATQQQTLLRLRQEHDVCLGVQRLRLLCQHVADALAPHRQAVQAARLMQALTQAEASRGRHRPVLSVGRDGITLGLRVRHGSIYEVATTATVCVLDRRGRRLVTVYLACAPEPGQQTLTQQLTALLEAVLQQWTGALPRLCYVTDAGDCETAYYRQVLRRLRHPRTGVRLPWCWVVDYYHAAARLGTLAEALFGKSPQAWAWQRRMQKLLLQPGGVGRVLHSAAALRSRRPLRGARWADFRRAYRYLQTRRQHLRYATYRRQGLPIGSGVTEAGCKTVYTQRLKLSGMRWSKAGAQTILTLRVLLLSGVWSEAYQHLWSAPCEVQVLTPENTGGFAEAKAG
jgi:hypothetical protein